MNDPALPLPGLSPVHDKRIVARFDSGLMSSDAGVLVLREIEQGLRIAEQMAGCLDDPRSPAQVLHGLSSMIRFRMLMIASGYEDGNDASTLRSDPAFKLAQGNLPSGPDLASQPTISRLENLPDPRALLRMGGHSSISFAPPAPECRNGSCLISMTPSMPSAVSLVRLTRSAHAKNPTR